jgi:uncharacterized protein YdeI (YjbR/CyaY-like superfamily)
MGAANEAREVVARDRAAWRRWLQRHHGTSGAVWLVLAKKGGTHRSPSYEEAVEEALCFGWIDSKANPLDEGRFKLWMAPRKRGSGWSAVNKRRIERLIEQGRMAPAGLAAIEAAKADGSWTKLDSSHALTMPPDLARAFRAHANAKANFDAFPPSTRRAILEWINAAKRPETRAKRVEETARLAERNERANQWRPKTRPPRPAARSKPRP